MADHEQETDFNTLIPELLTWDEGKPIDVGGWIARVGNYEHAVAYARLFWPEFTIHDDCVLYAGFNETSFAGFMAQTQGDKTAVEVVMNHRHILDLFPWVAEDPSEELIVHLGRVLKDIWSCKLQRDFPTRRIVVSFPESEIEDLLDYEVTFFQERA